MQVKLLNNLAKVPTRGSLHAAGHDLYSCEKTSIPPRGHALVSTGLSVAVPPGYYGRVAPRSGLAVKNAINTGAGVVDSDYRGEVKVVLFNHSDKEFGVQVGDRIAQFILEKISTEEFEVVNELDDTQRGAGGFGSTGTN